MTADDVVIMKTMTIMRIRSRLTRAMTMMTMTMAMMSSNDCMHVLAHTRTEVRTACIGVSDSS